MTLFENRVSAGVVKMRALAWALIQYDGCPYKKGNLDKDTDMHEGRVCKGTQREFM